MWVMLYIILVWISLCVFSIMTLLAVHFTFILDHINDVRQKANSTIFLSSKWVAKQQRQLATSAMNLAQELLMNIQCSDGARSFAKETRALKVRSIVPCHQKLTMTNWKESLKLSSYNDTRGWQRTQCWSSMVVRHLKQIGKVKKLDISVPHDLTEN